MTGRQEDRAALDRLASDLAAALGPGSVQPDQPLAQYTTLRIGGPAALAVVANTAEVLRQAVTLAWDHQVPCRVLGSGANVLVSDIGVDGLVVVNRTRAVSFCALPGEVEGGQGSCVRAESGASFSAVARQCVRSGLAGLEWATGIPGSVGGAVYGNAGAWGGEVASALISAAVLEPGGAVVEWPAQRFEYGYRTSILKRQVSQAVPQPVVLEAMFALRAADRAALEARVAEISVQRKAKQPPGASCGSVFKNPPGDYAGRLIEAVGLKGTRQGAAQISPVHGNFIVNSGGATAADVKTLIDLARFTVRAQLGVELQLEIQLVGDWPAETVSEPPQ